MNDLQIDSCFSEGWYRFAASSKIKKGQIYTFNFFERALICLRNVDNSISIFDAYCPHLGANLGEGKIESGLLICPFHGWKYDSSGQCVEIPYCKKIPKKAFLQSYPMKELNSFIYIYLSQHLTEVPIVDSKTIMMFSERIFTDIFSIHIEKKCFDKLINKANSMLFDFKSYGPGFLLAEKKANSTNILLLVSATPIDKKNLSVSVSISFKKTLNLLQMLYFKRKAHQKLKMFLNAAEIL